MKTMLTILHRHENVRVFKMNHRSEMRGGCGGGGGGGGGGGVSMSRDYI